MWVMLGPQDALSWQQQHKEEEEKDIDNDNDNDNDNEIEKKAIQHKMFLTLPHPSTGSPARYLLSRGGIEVLEVQRISDTDSELSRSWFIGNSVQNADDLCLVTRIDPLFLLLPFFEKTLPNASNEKGFFSELDQLLHHSCYNVGYLSRCVGEGTRFSLDSICDVKAIGDGTLLVYRLSESKVIAWIHQKINRMAEALLARNLRHLNSRNRSTTYVASSKDMESGSLDDFKRFSMGVICEYLSSSWTKRIADELHLPMEISQNHYIPSIQLSSNTGEKRKLNSNNGPTDDYSKNVVKKSTHEIKRSKAQGTFAKAAKSKGQRSILNFFKKDI